jgi:hypothetical protein
MSGEDLQKTEIASAPDPWGFFDASVALGFLQREETGRETAYSNTQETARSK